MNKHRAIPQGYMTIGELAKRMNTTVRTLQYYDREGILSPSCESEGGRRLYSEKDVVKLHQIQSMKYLGFSLDEIKNKLVFLETPTDVANALTAQAEMIRKKIASLSEVLQAAEALKTETLQMEAVNWGTYAIIVSLLQKDNADYWVIKHFDDKTLSHVMNHFDEQSGLAMFDRWGKLCAEAAKLQEDNVSPASLEGQNLAKIFWDFVTEFTGGDMSMLPKLMEFNQNKDDWDETWKKQWESAEGFVGLALQAYFTNLGSNPFEVTHP